MDVSQAQHSSMNEIESIRTHLQDYYAQLINAMRVPTYLKYEL